MKNTVQHLVNARYREAQRYRISHDVSYTEAVKQIGRTTVWTDGAYMDVPVGSDGPGIVSRPVQKSCVHECAVTKDTWIMNKVDFRAFIGKVIKRLRLWKTGLRLL